MCADDMSFGPKLRNEAEAIFAARKDKPDYVDYEFKDYAGSLSRLMSAPCGLLNIELA